VTEPLDELREQAAALAPPPVALRGYLDKVRTRAYTVTDEDVVALRAAGCSEDEIFEQTVRVAVGEGLRRLEAGLRVLP
jgi:alkylhydroperoxidase family enzyme